MFNLATMFVDIKADQGPFDRAMSGVHGQLTRADVAVGTFVGNVGSMFARVAVGLTGGLFSSTISSASSLNESISKTGTIFGGASGMIIAQAEQMATTFGLPKQAMLDAAGIMGLMAKGAGQSGAAAADFGNKMTKLAADAMSFYNVPFDVALQKIQSGLSGESEPLRAFGVFLNEANVKAEGLRMGLISTGMEMDEGQKIMARASLITKGLADAQGDLERTFTGTENQSRAFWGTLSNLGQDIGTTLLPAFNTVLAAGNALAKGTSEWMEANQGTVRGWVATFIEEFGFLGTYIRNAGDIWEIYSVHVQGEVESLFSVISTTWQNVVTIVEWAATNWRTLFADAIEASATGITNFGKNVGAMWTAVMAFMSDPSRGFNFQWTPLLEGFRATTSAFPEMMKPVIADVSGQIEAIEARMRGREAGAMVTPQSDISTLADSAARSYEKFGGKAEEDRQKAAAKKLVDEAFDGTSGEDAAGKKGKGNEIVGVADFASKMRLAQGGDDVPKKQLTELEQIRDFESQNNLLLSKLSPTALLG